MPERRPSVPPPQRPTARLDPAMLRQEVPARAAMRRAPAALLALVVLPACAAVPPADTTPLGPRHDHNGPAVVVISIDGLRPDALEPARATTLLRLIDEGAYQPAAQTVLPSRTLPSHTSMLTGVIPQAHGITWNEDRTREHGRVGAQTIFDHAARHGLTSAAIVAKAKFRHLIRDGSPTYAAVPSGRTIRTAGEIAAHVERRLRHSRPDLLYVHLPDPDVFGHAFGWMTRPYRFGVRRADAAVARVIGAADRAYGEGGYTLIITADHGGARRGHGRGRAEDRTIPWLAWGRGVCPGRISGLVLIEDTAPTVLELLGVPVPAVMTGRAVAVTACDA
jgi:hypothetical protein